MSEQVKKSHNLYTHKNHATSPHTIMQALHKKNHQTSPHKKSCNLNTQKSCNLSEWVRKILQPLHTKKHATSQHKTTMQPTFHTKNHVSCQQQNIARIVKRCPENITWFVKCVKLLCPKVLTKWNGRRNKLRGFMNFCGEVVWFFGSVLVKAPRPPHGCSSLFIILSFNKV